MYIGLAIEHLIMRKQKLLYLFVINTISLYKPISVVPYDYASNFSHSLLLFTWYSEPKRGSPRIVSALWTHCPQDFLFSYLFFFANHVLALVSKTDCSHYLWRLF